MDENGGRSNVPHGLLLIAMQMEEERKTRAKKEGEQIQRNAQAESLAVDEGRTTGERGTLVPAVGQQDIERRIDELKATNTIGVSAVDTEARKLAILSRDDLEARAEAAEESLQKAARIVEAVSRRNKEREEASKTDIDKLKEGHDRRMEELAEERSAHSNSCTRFYSLTPACALTSTIAAATKF